MHTQPRAHTLANIHTHLHRARQLAPAERSWTEQPPPSLPNTTSLSCSCSALAIPCCKSLPHRRVVAVGRRLIPQHQLLEYGGPKQLSSLLLGCSRGGSVPGQGGNGGGGVRTHEVKITSLPHGRRHDRGSCRETFPTSVRLLHLRDPPRTLPSPRLIANPPVPTRLQEHLHAACAQRRWRGYELRVAD